MRSLFLRVHVAIVAFAVGTAASMVLNPFGKPLHMRAHTTAHAPKLKDAGSPEVTFGGGVSEESVPLKSPFACASAPDRGATQGRTKPVPAYPPDALRARASGVVAVKVFVNEEGRVVEARAVSGHTLLRGAAVDAACRTRYSPTLLEGRPVSSEGTLTYNFVLE